MSDLGPELFVGAWALDRNARDRAAVANHQNRVNAFIAQGMTFEAATAAVQASYAHEAAWNYSQNGPQGASIIAILLIIVWTVFWGAVLITGTSWMPMVAAACLFVSVYWGVCQFRRFVARDAWKVAARSSR